MKTLGTILGGCLVVAIVLGCIVSAIAAPVINADNAIQRSMVTIRAQASQIQVVYQRRSDLVTQEIGVIKGQTAQELAVGNIYVAEAAALSGTFADYNAGKVSAETLQAQIAKADKAFVDVRTLVINGHPELKSDQAFQDFMIQVEGNENRIAIARRDYDVAVAEYQNLISVFPGSVLAGFRGYKLSDYPFFHADTGAQSVPKVDFSTPVPATVPAKQ